MGLKGRLYQALRLFQAGLLGLVLFAGSAYPLPAPDTPAPDLSKVDPAWHGLLRRLRADKLYGPDVEQWFAGLDAGYSERPMGIKTRQLFRQRFIPEYFPWFRKPQPQRPFYPGVVTSDNILKCRLFLEQHAALFQKVEEAYHVPREILTALLMVETRLGDFMGTEKAFWSLACMSAANSPEWVRGYLPDLPLNAERDKWLREFLESRSSRAYAELKALIVYCRVHEHNPLELRGSIYGAIGLCQFMPSNIAAYAVDGDKDGRIDLFSLADALPSAANFLKVHGWRKDSPPSGWPGLLRRYNNSDIYVNTVLALAEAAAAPVADPVATPVAPPVAQSARAGAQQPDQAGQAGKPDQAGRAGQKPAGAAEAVGKRASGQGG